MKTPDERGVHQRLAQALSNDQGEAELKKLLEDTGLYQSELETQNQELQAVQMDLDRQRQEYVTLFDLAPVGYVRLDHEGLIQNINLAACEQLAISRAHVSMRRLPMTGLLSGESHAAWFRLLRTASESNEPCEAEIKSAHRTAPRWLLAQARTLQTGGSLTSVLVCLQDITVRRDLEQALRKKNEEMRAQLEELGRFNRTAVDRELRMIELKQEVNKLLSEQGKETRYVIPDEP